ncbi:MAG: Flp pilus assembly complex ATPase component TadA [Candidatus Eisenbacteria sp.]|nr:Flp pilus assembly complex ATPase component TadA [Candidatus Eisenbacteria bacterium]
MIRRDVTRKPHLGELLVEYGLITLEQKAEALLLHKQSGRRLGETLAEMGLVTEENIARVLAKQAGLPFTRLRKGLVDPRTVQIISREKAELYEALPLFCVHGMLTLAVSDPNKINVLDIIRKLTGLEVQAVVTFKDDILHMIEEAYADSEGTIEDFASGLDEADIELVSHETTGRFEDIAEMAGQSPVINLVNQIILKAIRERASDIHLEPERQFFRTRFRIDGVLYDVMHQRIELHAPVISRLKIMANLDIAERRLPQDGRIQVLAQGRTVDLRFSSLPGVLGEKIVLRVLDKEAGIVNLDQLGFAPQTLQLYRSLLFSPHGLVLVTGPTGSGKTTTLYAGIRELNSIEKNIVTIEDPVEYQFDIINQNQVKDEIGLSFARILKHTLRQDPDIIMVGEIRDAETAGIAVQAALTGHLVLTTMHTNDAASSVTRLLEMGVESYLLASSLIGVIGQRLARTICPNCTASYHASQAEMEILGVSDKKSLQLLKGKGCPQCFDSGYRGRFGIYELLVVDPELQRILFQEPTAAQIRAYQMDRNLPSMRSEALRGVLEGKTTLKEVTRAVFVD